MCIEKRFQKEALSALYTELMCKSAVRNVEFSQIFVFVGHYIFLSFVRYFTCIVRNKDEKDTRVAYQGASKRSAYPLRRILLDALENE